MPNAFWVELEEIDFSTGADTQQLELGPDQSTTYAGDVSDQLVASEPFSFRGGR